jgi:hypothetical protein
VGDDLEGTVRVRTAPLVLGRANWTVLTAGFIGHHHGLACAWVTRVIARRAKITGLFTEF